MYMFFFLKKTKDQIRVYAFNFEVTKLILFLDLNELEEL